LSASNVAVRIRTTTARFFGDYTGNAWGGDGTFYAAWMDARDGRTSQAAVGPALNPGHDPNAYRVSRGGSSPSRGTGAFDTLGLGPM
jgi:hypothetical protein